LHQAAVDLFRIHRNIHDPIFYNRKITSATRFRWNSATATFSILYAVPKRITSLAETIVCAKLQGLLVIEERGLADGSVHS